MGRVRGGHLKCTTHCSSQTITFSGMVLSAYSRPICIHPPTGVHDPLLMRCMMEVYKKFACIKKPFLHPSLAGGPAQICLGSSQNASRGHPPSEQLKPPPQSQSHHNSNPQKKLLVNHSHTLVKHEHAMVKMKQTPFSVMHSTKSEALCMHTNQREKERATTCAVYQELLL